ncbi:MAG: fructose-6-phosphate aldolase [Bdellovibrionaceae bacterium]|nr:fructose-6-phosphate aldolase [Pseudobdellovibrionaceae bacterium]
MQFYIDTADISEVKEALSRGWIEGVTTNPSLIAKSGRDIKEVVKDLLDLSPGWISVEVLATQAEEMIKEGTAWAELGEAIVVKVPMTEEGMKAVRHFSAVGIKTNVTLVFSPLQALMAARAGATLVSPFVGRLDDIGHTGMELVEQIIQIYDNYDLETQVLVASVRNNQHILEAALLGAEVCTVPFKVLKQMLVHPLTDQGLDIFLKDAQVANGKR